jgi:hypothetical protein
MMITMAAAWYYRLPLSDYIAYCAVLCIALETVSQLETVLKDFGRIMPEARLCQPILDAQPEDVQSQQFVTHVEGTISISNTPNPGESGGCSIDVNLEVLYQQLLPRLRAEFVSRNALPEALGNVTGNSVKMQNGQLEVNKQYFDDQRNYDNNVFSS